MFSFLKRRSANRNAGPDSSPPETNPERMTLAERMTYRREMLYQSIRESLLQMQVISSMYRFRVMNLDERQHRFVAMIEVTNKFEAQLGGLPVGFGQVEEHIRKRTLERYGVSLDAIFWRVNEAQASFVRSRRAGDSANAGPAGANAPRLREVPGDVSAARQRLSRAQVDPVTPEEVEAFARAIQGTSPLEDISVKHLDYQSEMAPLQDTEETGGTQYGAL